MKKGMKTAAAGAFARERQLAALWRNCGNFSKKDW
jgi:hypothetical protein